MTYIAAMSAPGQSYTILISWREIRKGCWCYFGKDDTLTWVIDKARSVFPYNQRWLATQKFSHNVIVTYRRHSGVRRLKASHVRQATCLTCCKEWRRDGKSWNWSCKFIHCHFFFPLEKRGMHLAKKREKRGKKPNCKKTERHFFISWHWAAYRAIQDHV